MSYISSSVSSKLSYMSSPSGPHQIKNMLVFTLPLVTWAISPLNILWQEWQNFLYSSMMWSLCFHLGGTGAFIFWRLKDVYTMLSESSLSWAQAWWLLGSELSLKQWTCGVVSILTWQLSRSRWTPFSVTSGSTREVGCCCVCDSRLFINDSVCHHHNSVSLPDHRFGDTNPSQILFLVINHVRCLPSSHPKGSLDKFDLDLDVLEIQ